MTNTKLLTLLVITCLILIALVLVYPQASAPESNAGTALNEADQAALNLGQNLLKAKVAFADLNQKNAIDSVVQLGQDSRYYLLVRGWTTQHLSLSESRRETSEYKKSESYRAETEAAVKQLQQILRAIDLE